MRTSRLSLLVCFTLIASEAAIASDEFYIEPDAAMIKLTQAAIVPADAGNVMLTVHVFFTDNLDIDVSSAHVCSSTGVTDWEMGEGYICRRPDGLSEELDEIGGSITIHASLIDGNGGVFSEVAEVKIEKEVISNPECTVGVKFWPTHRAVHSGLHIDQKFVCQER